MVSITLRPRESWLTAVDEQYTNHKKRAKIEFTLGLWEGGGKEGLLLAQIHSLQTIKPREMVH